MKKLIGLLFFLCLSTFVLAQDNKKIREHIQKNEKQIIEEYIEFLSIPNVSTDRENIQKNADFIQKMMEKRNIKSQILKGNTPDINPVIYGEIISPNAKRTIGFYAHYDGQPVNPKQWFPGLEPFNPLLITAPLENGGTIIGPYRKGDGVQRDWRITGRGSADDKAGVMAIINAVEVLQKTAYTFSANIKFLFEGEEEIGSIHLDEIFTKNKNILQADCWIIIDGPRHVTGKKTISFGVRGDVNISLTVYGPKRPLHSGNYGNWAPNPALMLTHLLAGMKDENGKVLIPGFYDDVIPLTETEKKAISFIPSTESILKNELGIHTPEGNGEKAFSELLMIPTLTITGIQSANVGKLKANIIPSKAEASLDLRLVLGNDAEKQVQKVLDYIKNKGYFVIEREPTHQERLQYPKIITVGKEKGYNAQRTQMDLPIAKTIIKTLQATTTDSLVLIPSSGGSLPLYMFEQILKTKVITIPIVNYDNNQHAENENVSIQYLMEGIESVSALMMIQ